MSQGSHLVLPRRFLPGDAALMVPKTDDGRARRYLAEKPRAEDVLSVFSGLRPLLRGKAGASTARLSREHAMVVVRGGVLTVTGGKWTTYREMAEQVVDRAAELAGLAKKPCPTAELRLSDSEPANEGPSPRVHPRLPYTEADLRRGAQEERA